MKPWERYSEGPWAKYAKDRTDPVRDFGEGANVGISRTLGAPVDLVNAGLGLAGLGSESPVGGSQWIQQGMESVGIPATETRGMVGQVGEVVGTSAAALPLIVGPFVKGATAVQTATRAPATSTAGRIGEDIATTAVRSPGAFMAGETTAAATAGAGGYLVERNYPDLEGGRAIGEILGGLTPVSLATVLKSVGHVTPVGWAVRNVRGLVDALTRSGGQRRASDRVRRAVIDPDATRLVRSDVLESAPLTPAQRTEEPGLLSLERSVMDSTEQLKSDRANQLRDVNTAIREAFMMGEGAPENASAYLRHLLDARLRSAAIRAQERLEQASPTVSREAANRWVRNELDDALRDARTQERNLYRQIPEGTTVQTRNATLRFQRLWDETGQAQRGDFPIAARRFLNPENQSYLGESTSLKEIRSVQGKLREEARSARSDGKFNRARIADDLADALTEDIAAIQGDDSVIETVRRATEFSRELNRRFTRGEVGKVLGFDSTGGASVPAGMTLERLIGRSGPAGREGHDALRSAVRFADKHADTERGKLVSGYVDEYLLDTFNREAVVDGALDIRKAANFLRERSEILKRRPATAKKIQNAINARRAAVDVERMSDPAVSAAGVFLKAPPGKEIDRILTLPEPGKGMADLVSLAKTDASGRALGGLKQSFMDRLLGTAQGQSADVSDSLFVSGRKLTDELARPNVRQAAESLFTPEELQRMEQIRRTAVILDKARTARPADEGVIGDAPGQLTSMFARIGGAAMGRQLNTGTIQAPGYMASNFQKLIHAGINDPARRLLNDAIQDESLFRALMDDIRAPAQEEAAVKRLNAWTLSVLQELGYSEESSVMSAMREFSNYSVR